MEQQEDDVEALNEHEALEMEFFLENSLLVLAEQIAQDQRDLYALEELQFKAAKDRNDLGDEARQNLNAVYRHDFTDIDPEHDPDAS